MKKLIPLILALAMIFANILSINASSTGSVILSIEGFTVSSGFIKIPEEIEISDGESLYNLIYKTLGEENINYNEPVLGDELIAITADSGWFKVTKEIDKVLETNKIVNTKNFAEEGWLSSNDFTNQSRWFVLVNNIPVTVPLKNYMLASGDVVRVTFSVYGNGADINQPLANMSTFDTATPIFPDTNRDELYRSIVKYNNDSDFDIDDDVIDIATDVTATQQKIDEAVTMLNGAATTDDFEEDDDIDDDDDDDDAEEPDDDDDFLGEDNDDDDDDDIKEDNRPIETTATKPAETTANDNKGANYIPDDGKGSGNLPLEDSAPTGVSILKPVAITALAGMALVTFRKKIHNKKK